ncbi:hypothetical protein HY389_00240 [Candidatus Daviesbacteria bacterium]|nr:hypothetical protein [Candidatus Daviesbacteria bacterium]
MTVVEAVEKTSKTQLKPEFTVADAKKLSWKDLRQLTLEGDSPKIAQLIEMTSPDGQLKMKHQLNPALLGPIFLRAQEMRSTFNGKSSDNLTDSLLEMAEFLQSKGVTPVNDAKFSGFVRRQVAGPIFIEVPQK